MTVPKSYPSFPPLEFSESCSWEDERRRRLELRDYRDRVRQCEKTRRSPIYSKIMSLAGQAAANKEK
jgi:hypothetical protein